MQPGVTSVAERNEVILGITARVAAENLVMNFEV
jgi:hypothetical protein